MPVYAGKPDGGASPYFDSRTVKMFARALLDSNLSIGLFHVPNPLKEEPRKMKSGEIPEYEESFMHLMIGQNLKILYTSKVVKGEFDNIIFMEGYSFSVRENEEILPAEFIPYPASDWLLVLRKGFSPEGKPLLDWIKRQPEPDSTKSFLNYFTAYGLKEDPFSSICVKWPAEAPSIEYMTNGSQDLLEDLIKLKKTIDKLPANRKDPTCRTILEKLIKHLKDPIGKAIGEEVLKKYPQETIKENKTGK
jgi:hypothetical protein